MTDDLKAIDILSQRFLDQIGQQKRSDSPILGDHIVIREDDPLFAQGQKVLRMYEGEVAKAPDDKDVELSMAQHLYRIGWLYYQILIPHFLNDKQYEFFGASSAQSACIYMERSYLLRPSASAASVLADIFHIARFYGSALHWYEEAAKVSAAFDDKDAMAKARAQQLDLQADGKTADPPLARNILFPQLNTPGLIPSAQHSSQFVMSQVPSESSTIASPISNTDKIFQEQMPRIQQLIREKVGPVSGAMLHNDQTMVKSFGLVYRCLPAPVRYVLKEQVFITFCLTNRNRLIQVDETQGQDVITQRYALKKPNQKLIKLGAQIAGVSFILCLLFPSFSLAHLLCLGGIGLMIYGFVKGEPT